MFQSARKAGLVCPVLFFVTEVGLLDRSLEQGADRDILQF